MKVGSWVLTKRGERVALTIVLLASAAMGLFFPWESMPWYGLDLR